MVRSTFAGFSTAQRAMAASQRALDVVGQNVSNVNTPGYTRQRLDIQSISPAGHSMWNSTNSAAVGYGVEMTGVSQIRDPYLDIQYRAQLADTGTVDAMDAVLSRLGDVFDETSRTNIREALNNVVSQLQNMSNANNAGQDTADNLVRSAMQVLLNCFHDSAESVSGLKEELVGRLEGTEEQKIQSYLNQIVELNKSIKTAQVLGNPALELQDQRNSLLDELATYLPIDVEYISQKESLGSDVYTLKVSISYKEKVWDEDTQQEIEVTKQITLIDDSKAAKFEIGSDEGMPPLSITVTGTEDGAEATDITYKTGDGVLKGYVDMLNKSGPFDEGGSDVKGIGYYEQYFDAFVDKFATTLNEMNVPDTIPEGKKPEDYYLFTTADGSDRFTASNIQISEAWMNGQTKITTTTGDPAAEDGASANESANDNVLKMINALTTEKWKITVPGSDPESVLFEGNFFDIYDNLQNTQATERQSVSSILANRVTVLNQIANSKDSVSGVSMDEEVMDMMRYQQSYNAAARLMTTLDEALDTLINNTGVVGR